jgi:glycosyltransferase involved in cell wall biosynthesis
MACGTPVVASVLPALSEAGGFAAIYCRVGDLRVWSDTVNGLLDEREQRPEMWESSARGLAARRTSVRRAGFTRAACSRSTATCCRTAFQRSTPSPSGRSEDRPLQHALVSR